MLPRYAFCSIFKNFLLDSLGKFISLTSTLKLVLLHAVVKNTPLPFPSFEKWTASPLANY